MVRERVNCLNQDFQDYGFFDWKDGFGFSAIGSLESENMFTCRDSAHITPL